MPEAVGVAAVARAAPDRTAIVAGDRRLTFAELDERVNRCARALRRLGVGEGDRVAVAYRNRPGFYEAALATARLRADTVPVSWRYKEDEARYMVEDSGAAVIFAEADGPAPAKHVVRHGAEHEAFLASEPSDPLVDPDDPTPATWRNYTSGTTGLPKAVARPKADTPTAVARAFAYLALFRIEGTDHRHLVCGPLYHTAPSAYSNLALFRGHTVVLMERFDAEECLRLIQRERVTWTHMVPINFVRILALPGEARARYDLSSVQRILHAAAPCPVETKRRILDVFPPGTVWEYYGATEGFVTMITPDEWLRKPGSVGRAALGLDVRILDPDGGELPRGEVGLVYASTVGGARFAYDGAPEKTDAAWRGDLFTVGDMGYLDEEGYLFLTDRKADMIISGGANVYPAEVEGVLYQHDGVADVSVIGVPDDEWGERVHAIVEARASIDPGELIAFCRERLAHYKCPRTVELVDRLPRDENGKVRKRELRERYWAGRDRRI